MTARTTERLVARLIVQGYLQGSGQYPAHSIRAEAATMERFLRGQDASFSSASGYPQAAGMSDDQLATIRHQLLKS